MSARWNGRRWEVKERVGSAQKIHYFNSEDEANAFSAELAGTSPAAAKALATEAAESVPEAVDLDEEPAVDFEFTHDSTGNRIVIAYTNPTDEPVTFWRSVGSGNRTNEVDPGDTEVRSYLVKKDTDDVEVRLNGEDGPVVGKATPEWPDEEDE